MSYLLGVAGMSNSNSIFNRLERLKHIGEQLIFRELTLEDKKFVSEALIQIGNGEEPKVALDIKGRTGESKGQKARDAADRKLLVKMTIQARRDAGEKLEDIIFSLGEHGAHIFGLSEETLRSYAQSGR
jgi:hypothetical protein|tara:strand:+ start:59 stop:445 length:387 start_codon:yes stop_codon:yes gene_type:complete